MIQACRAALFRKVVFDNLPLDCGLFRSLAADAPKYCSSMVRVLKLASTPASEFLSKHAEMTVEDSAQVIRSLHCFPNLHSLDIAGLLPEVVPLTWTLSAISSLSHLQHLACIVDADDAASSQFVRCYKQLRSVSRRISSLELRVNRSCNPLSLLEDEIDGDQLVNFMHLEKFEAGTVTDSRCSVVKPVFGPHPTSFRGDCWERFVFNDCDLTSHFSQLTTLSIRYPLFVEAATLMSILAECPGISHLDVATASKAYRQREEWILQPLRSEFFASFARCSQKLISLSMQQWITDVSDRALIRVARSFPALQEFLFLPRHRRVDLTKSTAACDGSEENPNALRKLVKSCPMLKSLCIGDPLSHTCTCQKTHREMRTCSTGFKLQRFGHFPELAKLSQIQSLSLSHVNLTPSTVLYDIAQHCPNIRHLILSHVSADMEAKGIPLLAETIELCPMLRSICIVDEHLAINTQLITVLSKLLSLEHITLCSNQQIETGPGEALHLLVSLSGIPRSATYIHVSCKPAFRFEAIEVLALARALRPTCHVHFATESTNGRQSLLPVLPENVSLR